MAAVDRIWIPKEKSVMTSAIKWIYHAHGPCKKATGHKLLDHLDYRIRECHAHLLPDFYKGEANFTILHQLPERVEDWIIFQAIKPNKYIYDEVLISSRGFVVLT